MGRTSRGARCGGRDSSHRPTPLSARPSPVSTAHAIAVGANALSLVLGGHFDGDAMWTRWNWRLAASFAFSAGYSLQDMAVMLRQRETAEMWLHHAVVFAGSFFMLVRASPGRSYTAPTSHTRILTHAHAHRH